jgi:hypothetical protein
LQVGALQVGALQVGALQVGALQVASFLAYREDSVVSLQVLVLQVVSLQVVGLQAVFASCAAYLQLDVAQSCFCAQLQPPLPHLVADAAWHMLWLRLWQHRSECRMLGSLGLRHLAWRQWLRLRMRHMPRHVAAAGPLLRPVSTRHHALLLRPVSTIRFRGPEGSPGIGRPIP